jgi:hypothetical protein
VRALIQIKAQRSRMGDPSALNLPLYMPFPFIKEQICIFFSNMDKFCLDQFNWADSYEKVAV